MAMEGGQSSLFEEFTTPQDKRYVDKDGFAFPAPGGLHKDKGKQNYLPAKEKEEENHFLQYDESSQYFEPNLAFGESNKDNITDDDNHVETPSDKGAAQQDMGSRSNIQTLMSRMMQETISLHRDWSKIFSESEEFETNCLEKLTAYTDQAKKLETNLDRQKNALCHRIRGIGGILQTFE